MCRQHVEFLTKVCQSENNAADISIETVFKGVRRVCVFYIVKYGGFLKKEQGGLVQCIKLCFSFSFVMD